MLLNLISWLLEYHITLHVDDALDSLDDHLNEGESRPNKVMLIIVILSFYINDKF